MKTISEQQKTAALSESLLKASHSAAFLGLELIDAHAEVCQNGDQFGVIVLAELLKEAGDLKRKIDRALAAVKQGEPA